METFDIFDVALILAGTTLLLLGLVTFIVYSVMRIRARRDALQPMLGVVLPKEDEGA
jgi:hypothetical protein